MSDTKDQERETRPARAGETDTTRFGMEPSAAEEPNATGGGLASGPGSGGGSSANTATGDADENMIDEDVK